VGRLREHRAGHRERLAFDLARLARGGGVADRLEARGLRLALVEEGYDELVALLGVDVEGDRGVLDRDAHSVKGAVAGRGHRRRAEADEEDERREGRRPAAEMERER